MNFLKKAISDIKEASVESFEFNGWDESKKSDDKMESAENWIIRTFRVLVAIGVVAVILAAVFAVLYFLK